MLLNCIAAENRKLRRSVIWAVFLVAPLISAVYGTFNYLQNLDILRNGWYSLWTQHTLFYALFFFSPLVAVYAAYLWRLEHLRHNWNLIAAAPVRALDIALAKFVATARMALLTQGWVLLLFTVCGKLWARLPGWPPLEIVIWLMRGFVGGLGIIALQCLLSMVIRGFALPVLVALGGGIVGMLFLSRNAEWLWPYALMLRGMNAAQPTETLPPDWMPFLLCSFGYAAAFLILSGIILARRDVRA